MTDRFCLGLQLLGTCKYDPTAPASIYFSIGELIGAIALILAFSQLLKPIVRFRLSVSPFPMWAAYATFIVAAVCVLLAAIIPQLPIAGHPVIGFPIFWEFVAGMVFCLAASYLLYFSYAHARYNNSNYRTYLSRCIGIIANGSMSDISDLASEISTGLPEIVKEAARYNRFSWDKSKPLPDSVKYATHLLDIWSDEKFCQALACSAPASLMTLFQEFRRRQYYHGAGYALINEVIRQSFLQKDSMLNREKQYRGLGVRADLTKEIFFNYDMIRSSHRPLQAWDNYRDGDMQPWKVERYGQCLLTAVKGYFNSGHFWECPLELHCGFDVVAGLARHEIWRIGDDKALLKSDAPPARILDETSEIFHEVYKVIVQESGRLPSYKDYIESLPEDRDRFSDPSIYEAYAEALFEYLCHLSQLTIDDWYARHLATRIWFDIFSQHQADARPLGVYEIRDRLSKKLLKKVSENLVEQHYPPLTRLIISLSGIWSSDASDNEFSADFFKWQFLELLKKEFPAAYSRDAKKAADMLPGNVEYDSDNRTLIMTTHVFKEVHTLKLNTK